MVAVLGDASLYAFTGGMPPDLETLRERYVRQAAGQSEDGAEQWGNWIARRRWSDEAIGFVQATLGSSGAAEVAWLIGAPWQGNAYAAEAASALVDWLEAAGVETVEAHIQPENAASA